MLGMIPFSLDKQRLIVALPGLLIVARPEVSIVASPEVLMVFLSEALELALPKVLMEPTSLNHHRLLLPASSLV